MAVNNNLAIFVNSFIGRPGNIGMRTKFIIAELEKRGITGICVCRGTDVRFGRFTILGMGLLGHLPRALNAFKIYVAPKFKHRLADIRLFEFFSLLALRGMHHKGAFKVSHLGETSPILVRHLHRAGIKVILDIAIVPNNYNKRLVDKNIAPFLQFDSKISELEITALKTADHVIVPSTFVYDEVTRLGIPRERIDVIEFGSDPATTRADHLTELPETNAGLNFCFLGAVNLRKGIRELLDVWSGPEFAQDKLHLCGRVNPGRVGRLLKQHGENVICPGFVHPPTYLQKCHVLVFPSWMEGSAKAVYEAMAMGIPAIVTTSSGSIIRDGLDGFVIAPGDREALREKMLFFKRNRDKLSEMGANAQANVSNYTWERYAHRVVDVYERLAK